MQPAASANGSFWLTIRNGKFHGVMIETTPIGSRSTDAQHGVAEIGVGVAGERARKRRRIAPDVDGAADLAARLGNRLAGFQSIEPGDFLEPRLDQVGRLEQDRGTLAGLHPRPGTGLEGVVRGLDRRLDFRLAGLAHSATL